MGAQADWVHDREAPCAVCQAPNGLEYSVVVPGNPRCPTGFNLDYKGSSVRVIIGDNLK